MVTASSKNNFEVENGKIEIAGQGLDLRNIDKSELITRIAEIYAPIYAGEELNIKLGSNSKKNKPEFALDGKVLGSMYAGRIKIISNEEGVGVKSQGITYADKGDVIISSKGKVYLKNTQAKNNIDISAKETEINEKLLAENMINIENKKLLNKGKIAANNYITVKGDVENNKSIFSGKDLNIEECLSRKPRHISIGQAQRVAIARALIKNANFYFFDEPFSNLDKTNRDNSRFLLMDIIRKYRASVIYVTHSIREATALADKVVVMNEGKIIFTGNPEDLYQADEPIVKELIEADKDE